ncbi:MAG TPA: EsaB/YukD family protein [Blastocatellia bacterium]|nr:EsaB/YukD family protein [Blastocatellia bacterium]
MPVLNIDLMTPDGVLFEGNEIPDDLQIEELVSRLVNTLGLPRVTARDEPIEYSLEIANQGLKLQKGQTLGDAGATNGDVIRLVSSHKIQRPLESQPARKPAVTAAIPAAEQVTDPQPSGDDPVLVIRPTSSVTKTIRRLKDGMGFKTEEISILDRSRLKAAATAGSPPPPPKSNRRTVMLGAMLIAGCLFLGFAVYSKKRAVPVAQASEMAAAQTPPPEPTPELMLEPVPEPSIIPMPTPKYQAKPVPLPTVNLPQPKPVVVVQSALPPPPPPEELKKRCGFWRNVFVGCQKDKKEKRGQGVGGAAGAAKSAAVSNGRSVIRRGVNYPARRVLQ